MGREKINRRGVGGIRDYQALNRESEFLFPLSRPETLLFADGNAKSRPDGAGGRRDAPAGRVRPGPAAGGCPHPHSVDRLASGADHTGRGRELAKTPVFTKTNSVPARLIVPGAPYS